MRKKTQFSSHSDGTFLGLAMIPIAIWLYFIICWIVNLVKLLNCDFEGPWKEEIIHAIGLIGPVAGVTAWF